MTDIQIIPVAGHIGAELEGIDLSGTIDADTCAAVLTAVRKYKVVFIRGQNLDYSQHVAYARALGAILDHPTLPGLDNEKHIFPIESRRGTKTNIWHSDLTFLPAPPAVSILWPIQLPPYGGDTMWANTAYAYETLPTELRSIAERLRAVHTNVGVLTPRSDTDAEQDTQSKPRELLRTFAAEGYYTEHPVVIQRPDTGERNILAGHFVQELIGVPESESQALLDRIQQHILQPEYAVRWKWNMGDISISDNLATQHYPIADYAGFPRAMRRITLAGTVPTGVDGRPGGIARQAVAP